MKVKTYLSFLMVLGMSLSFVSCDDDDDDDKDLPESIYTSGPNVVSYVNDGDKIAAHLYVPEGFNENEDKTYPTVVVSPPFTGIKEQTAGIYAEELSKLGYVALAYDPRGWGESEGYPFLGDGFRMSDDLNQSITYLSKFPFVDKENIFSLGICMGASFAAYNAIEDDRVKAVGQVSAYLTAGDEYSALLPDAVYAPEIYEQTPADQVQYLTAVYEPGTEGYNMSAPIVQNMATYYLEGRPGYHVNWANSVSSLSLPAFATFNIYDHMDAFTASGKPLVSIIGTEAVSREGGERFYNGVDTKKELLMVEGAGHFELYYMPEYVSQAVPKINQFFSNL